jgi:hypothetical protein
MDGLIVIVLLVIFILFFLLVSVIYSTNPYQLHNMKQKHHKHGYRPGIFSGRNGTNCKMPRGNLEDEYNEWHNPQLINPQQQNGGYIPKPNRREYEEDDTQVASQPPDTTITYQNYSTPM